MFTGPGEIDMAKENENIANIRERDITTSAYFLS